MADKLVFELPGVDETLGKRLEAAGFDKAYRILGKFLILKKDAKLFKKWMKDTCNANSKQAADCYQYLSCWYDNIGVIKEKKVSSTKENLDRASKKALKFCTKSKSNNLNQPKNSSSKTTYSSIYNYRKTVKTIIYEYSTRATSYNQMNVIQKDEFEETLDGKFDF